jgi:hypothetical protein
LPWAMIIKMTVSRAAPTNCAMRLSSRMIVARAAVSCGGQMTGGIASFAVGWFRSSVPQPRQT